uniref:Uncharacterized protein n=1 Tax=Solanum lycopersicum TaxID=4081 RepID=A0A3Q7GUP5_SOLLC
MEYWTKPNRIAQGPLEFSYFFVGAPDHLCRSLYETLDLGHHSTANHLQVIIELILLGFLLTMWNSAEETACYYRIIFQSW